MGLKLPAQIDRISLDRDERPVAFMPVGFVPFDEHQLGNGDVFGLYWPIGREQDEPFVMETFHDEGALVPAFSSLAIFLERAGVLDEGDHAAHPTLDDDPSSPLALYKEARNRLRRQDGEGAVALLESVVRDLPEYTNAVALLGAQYLRSGRHDDACRLAVQTILSPPSFGTEPHVCRMAAWLSKQDRAPRDMVDDPIWCGRVQLASLHGGGGTEDSAYAMLRDAIDAYASNGRLVQALTAMQTYGELLNAQTVSRRQRHGFVFEDHWQRQREFSALLPGGPRHL